MGLDDTIERRRGDPIRAKGIYRDPVRSSRHHFVKASGLRWLSLMLLAPIGWTGWLLIRDPHHTFAPQALLSTHLSRSPRQILTFFMQRWAVETTFEEARAHLGLETQRPWNDRAIARTTPILLALFSLVTLIAHRWVKKRAQGCHDTAWYKKVKPTFADALAGIRKQIWATFLTIQSQDDRVKIPRALFNRLIHTVCYAT